MPPLVSSTIPLPSLIIPIYLESKASLSIKSGIYRLALPKRNIRGVSFFIDPKVVFSFFGSRSLLE